MGEAEVGNDQGDPRQHQKGQNPHQHRLAPREPVPGEPVGREGPQHEGQAQGGERQEDAVQEVPLVQRAREHPLEVLERQRPREQGGRVRENLLDRPHARTDHPEDRHQNQQGGERRCAHEYRLMRPVANSTAAGGKGVYHASVPRRARMRRYSHVKSVSRMSMIVLMAAPLGRFPSSSAVR